MSVLLGLKNCHGRLLSDWGSQECERCDGRYVGLPTDSKDRVVPRFDYPYCAWYAVSL